MHSVGDSRFVILLILYWCALSDGCLDQKELDVIKDSADLLAKSATTLPGSSSTLDLANSFADLANVKLPQLLAILDSDDQKLLVKLAFKLYACSRRQSDISDFNNDEKKSYRILINELNLSEHDVRESEWAAKDEIERESSQKSIARFLAGLTAKQR
jgi:hypothetical protein